MADRIRIKKTSDGFNISRTSKKAAPVLSSNNHEDLTGKSISLTEKSITITRRGIYATIFSIVVTIISLISANHSNNQYYRSDSNNLNSSKENIRNATNQIKNEFNPKKIAGNFDLGNNPRIRAFCEFQKSVLALVYLQEPHEKSHFRGGTIDNQIDQVKNNLISRIEYDDELKLIMLNISSINDIEKQTQSKSDNSLEKRFDSGIINESILLCYKNLAQKWVNNDLERNNTVDNSLEIFKNLTGRHQSEMEDEFSKVIQPLVLFEQDTMNYYFREDLYNYFLSINGKYMTEIELN